MCTCYLAYRYISEKKVAIRKKEDIVFVVRYLLYLLYITYVYIICKQLLYNVLGTAKDQTFFTLKQVASLFCYQLLNYHLELLGNLRKIYVKNLIILWKCFLFSPVAFCYISDSDPKTIAASRKKNQNVCRAFFKVKISKFECSTTFILKCIVLS